MKKILLAVALLTSAGVYAQNKAGDSKWQEWILI